MSAASDWASRLHRLGSGWCRNHCRHCVVLSVVTDTDHTDDRCRTVAVIRRLACVRCTSSSQNLKWASCQQRPFGLIWPGLCWQLAFRTFCENDVRLTCSSRGLINDRADKGTVHQFASCSLGIWSAKFQFCSTHACGVYYVSVAAPQLRVPIGVKTLELWRVVGAEACRERLDVESNPLVENSSIAPRRKARRELCENHQCLRP